MRDCTIDVVKNKGTDQLHTYSAADLLLCFGICKKQVLVISCENVLCHYTYNKRVDSLHVSADSSMPLLLASYISILQNEYL